MQLYLNRSMLVLFVGISAYIFSIGLGAVMYLPYQEYAPGVFREYAVGVPEMIGMLIAAFICTAFFPKNLNQPSSWFLAIFNILLLAPGLALCIAADDLDPMKKIVIFPALVMVIAIISLAGRVGGGGAKRDLKLAVGRGVLYFALLGWSVLCVLLFAKYHGVMRFSDAASIYEQRALTADVGGMWGYINLYFVYVFSTLLVAYGLSRGGWSYYFLGSFGYFLMFLITAEKSQLAFPVFFLGVWYVSKHVKDPIRMFGWGLIAVALVVVGIVFFGDQIKLFDAAGFYLFSRLIASPAQFILDYFDFFSTHGYTYFSHVRGFDFFVDTPNVYASHPKWPQLGWVVGSGLHGIESNSNATFLASDGAASLGVVGMILVGSVFSFYLMVVNSLSVKFPKEFWAIIFAQQAFLLVSVSFFSLLLSFGGFFYLLFLFLLKAKRSGI